MALVSCASTPEAPTPDADKTPGSGEQKPELLRFEGITFSDLSVTYNGSEHEIKVSGNLPTSASVAYTANKGINAGTYNATATLTCDGYETKVLSATLKINKANISGITFKDETVEYDAKPHSLFILGNVPSGVVVTYTYNGSKVDEVTAVGEYNAVATLSSPNHNTLTLEARLTIKSTESRLNAVNFKGTIYFQNDLDNKRLYKIKNGAISKVSNDIPASFFTDGTSLYYYSTSLFSKVIKKIDADGNVSQVHAVNGDYLTTDGTYIYYSVNSLLNSSENGIYRMKLDSDSAPTRISTSKAAYLTVLGNYIYYSNLSENKYLYRLPLGGGAATLVFDQAVEYLITDGSSLYFDASKLTGSAIYKYSASSGATKLCSDSGKYLSKIGNDIYYINNDLITSTLFGDGIYKISTTSSGALTGTKVLSTVDNGYSSLTSDGTYLYYYKLNDKHLWRYNISSGDEIDLMANFVPPVEQVSLVGNGVMVEYNGEIYYTNPRDGLSNGACLYKYNPTTRQHFKVLADDVAGVWFHGGMMYYSTCVLTNYALFRMDLTTGESIKINSDRCEDLIFEGDYLYYLNVSFTGANSIMRIKLADIGAAELKPETVYKDKNIAVTGVSKVGSTFYFVVNPAIGSQKLYKYTMGDAKATDLGETAFEVVADGDVLYFYDDYDNEIKCYNGGKVTTIVSNVTANDLLIKNGVLYYSSTAKTVGVYSYTIKSGTTKKIHSGAGDALTLVNGNLYFIGTAIGYTTDYPVHSGEGDGYLYCYNGTTTVKK